MKPTTVRLDEALQAKLDAIQASLGATQAVALREVIEFYHTEKIAVKPAVMRWIDINALAGRHGEIDWSEVDCPECHEAIDRPFKALFADGSWSATVCSRCATSE